MRSRLYSALLEDHFDANRQMAFVSGPRQVGKTTVARQAQRERGAGVYLNWDVPDHRLHILDGASEVAAIAGLDELREERSLIVLDELHKAPDWKQFLKGLFDGYGERADILVTGSGNLETFRGGGESLMGRYFSYRMHPFSVGELGVWSPPGSSLLRPPRRVNALDDLLRFGGFPEPLERAEETFHTRWRTLRSQQLVREEVSNLTAIQELDQLEVLAELLRRQAGELMNYSSIAGRIRVAVDTVTRWLTTLSALYYCFKVRPWHRNIARALRKQPKFYLWDWSAVPDPGKRRENLMASALLKSTHLWTDLGYGDFELYFIRDKQQHEVDFLVTRDDEPWFLVEVKSSASRSVSPALERFQEQTGAAHAFQVAFDADYVDRDCFEASRPLIVPARTLLSQLV